MANKEINKIYLIRLAKDNPLATVMITAIVFRLLAVIFSKGYLYTDDHYETVSVAYKWLQNGLFSDQGFITWGGRTDPETIRRSPVYTLCLFGVMKFLFAFGIESLDKLMYGVRAFNSLISLISVYAIYKSTEIVTKSTKWALIGGLLVALHFAFPTLSSRTLIEFFSGNFWILAIYFLLKHEYKRQDSSALFLSGVATGIAWVIRFQIVFAAFLVPIILIWQYKRIRESLIYSYGVIFVIIISGLLEYWLLGSFLQGTLSQLPSISDFQSTPPVSEPVWVYAAVLIFLFIPPLSIITFILAGIKKFWFSHRMIVFTTLSFILFHTLLWNRQERFLMPILPVVLLIMVLVIWQQFSEKGLLFKYRKTTIGMVLFSAAINLILLPLFTMNYGHKGLVEPMVEIEHMGINPTIVFFSPEKYNELYPDDYVGFSGRTRFNITSWKGIEKHIGEYGIDTLESYYILYPKKKEYLQAYLDSLEIHLGTFEPLFHVGPSTIDCVLHLLNPHHNPTHEAWIFKHNVNTE